MSAQELIDTCSLLERREGARARQALGAARRFEARRIAAVRESSEVRAALSGYAVWSAHLCGAIDATSRKNRTFASACRDGASHQREIAAAHLERNRKWAGIRCGLERRARRAGAALALTWHE